MNQRDLKDTKRILIVDDSKADRRVYRRYLSQDFACHYNVFEAESVQAGLDLCKTHLFDAILLDYQMPEKSGLQALSDIKKYQPHVAIVMLTGHGDEQVAVQAMKGGAQDYLVKDHLKKDFLQHTVRHVIAQAQLRQQLQRHEKQQQLIAEMGFQIRQSLELEQTLETLVKKVRALLQCDRVLAYQFTPDMSGQIIAESVGDGWKSTLGQTVTDTYFKEQGAEDYCKGRKQIIADIYQASLDPCHLKLLEQFDVKAVLVLPILMGKVQPHRHSSTYNQLWGLIVAHQCLKPRDWQLDEIQMLDALSVHCTIAIQHAELLAQTQVALEKAQALTEFKSQVIATISHEYNSPITAIKGAAQVLQQYHADLDAPKRERLLNIVIDKTNSMSALVEDMLLVHQSEMNKLTLKPTSFDLNDFLWTIITDQQLMAPQHQLTLKVRGDVGVFWGDRGLLKVIFNNLLSNAIKYSPEGGDVKIYLIGDPDQVICDIKDNGIGIPEIDQKQLCQPFFRGSNVSTIAGTGLGLQIVKSAIELHQGTIDIRSKEGKGTQVSVLLPKIIPASSEYEESD